MIQVKTIPTMNSNIVVICISITKILNRNVVALQEHQLLEQFVRHLCLLWSHNQTILVK